MGLSSKFHSVIQFPLWQITGDIRCGACPHPPDGVLTLQRVKLETQGKVGLSFDLHNISS